MSASNAPLEQSSIFNQTNSSIPFSLSQGDTIQLSPFGSFSHPRGMQLVDQPAAANIIKNFNSFFARLGRRFAGVPFFIGHPDVPGCENEYPDKKAYGWIMELFAREDGLYARAKWSKAGQELLENAHYKFLSPFWEVSDAGFDKGRKLYRPHTLISVGLTNNPNLPVLPLSNAERRGRLRQLCFLGNTVTFGLPSLGSDFGPRTSPSAAPTIPAQPAHDSTIQPCNDLTTDSETDMNQQNKNNERNNMNPNDQTLKNEEREILNNEEFSRMQNSQTVGERPLEPQSSILNQTNSSIGRDALANVQSEIANLKSTIANLNSRLLTVVIDNAIVDGRLTPAQREQWMADLNRDFERKSVELANAARTVKTADRLENYAKRIDPNSKEAAKKLFMNTVKEQEKQGKTYEQAWTHIKAEYPDLYVAAFGPEREYGPNVPSIR